MSKPLELTIYPHSRKHMSTNWLTFYETPDGLRAAGRSGVMPAAKHLTDAELAAEYWQERDHVHCLFRNDPEDTPGLIPAIQRAAAIEDVLYRFATHPHYFEETE